MSVTTKKNDEGRWVVYRDGVAIGDVGFEERGAGGVDTSRQYRPYFYTDRLDEDGERILHVLPHESSLRRAAAAVAGFSPQRYASGLYQGRRFTHSRIREERDLTQFQECVVTRIVRGTVYYKTIHGADANHQLILGGGGCFPVEQWSRWAVS